jgi:hypothetical protein
MIKLKSIELSAPFRYERQEAIVSALRVGDHVKSIELNEDTGIIKIVTKKDNVVFTSLSNAKAAYADESETSGNLSGTKKPSAKAS